MTRMQEGRICHSHGTSRLSELMQLLKGESFDAFLTSGYDSSTSRHKQGISVRTLISKREQQYARTDDAALRATTSEYLNVLEMTLPSV
jgi:hypothetical protein